MQFRTELTLTPAPWSVGYDDKLMLVGSCFSEHIGHWLEEHFFDVAVNPYGVLYNPASTARCLRQLRAGQPWQEADLFLHDGLYRSLDHHSRLAAPTAAEALRRINEATETGGRQLREATRLLVTWGTAWVYAQADAPGRVVANCHKLPAACFTRRRLSVSEIVDDWSALLGELLRECPKLHVVFTVSPIRHLKDTLQGNQLSKATLLLAIEELTARFPDRTDYFPAYELLVDDLRDYRFYATDLVHPSESAISYVREKFAARYFTPTTTAILAQCEKVARALAHRPTNPTSEVYQRFLMQNIATIKQLTDKYAFFTAEKPLAGLQARLELLKNTEITGNDLSD